MSSPRGRLFPSALPGVALGFKLSIILRIGASSSGVSHDSRGLLSPSRGFRPPERKSSVSSNRSVPAGGDSLPDAPVGEPPPALSESPGASASPPEPSSSELLVLAVCGLAVFYFGFFPNSDPLHLGLRIIDYAAQAASLLH